MRGRALSEWLMVVLVMAVAGDPGGRPGRHVVPPSLRSPGARNFALSYPSTLAFEFGYPQTSNSFQYLYRPLISDGALPEPYEDHRDHHPSNSHHDDDDDYCPSETHCRPLVHCAVWFDSVVETHGAACQLPHKGVGVCCPDLPRNGRGKALRVQIKKVKLEVSSYHPIDLYAINAAAGAARTQLRQMDETEKLLVKQGLTARRNSAAFTHLLFFQSNSATQRLSRKALLGVLTTSQIGNRFDLSADESGFGLSQFSLRDTTIADSCPADPECSRDEAGSAFRTIDGSCNNLKRTARGRSRTPFQRLLSPQYEDGVWSPRVAVDGSKLPSARLVSISVIPDVNSPDKDHSLWVMQYGQFVDHDLTSTPVFRIGGSGSGIVCCTDDGDYMKNPSLVHPECLPIDIPADDPFFSKFRQRCMSFIRSMPAPRPDCNFGFGEQMNQITHFLDASNVYGSNDEEARELRSFQGGQLKVTSRSHHGELDLLPPDNTPDMECVRANGNRTSSLNKEFKCFKAGDSRSNEAPQLAVAHTVFMRQHNRLAAELGHVNGHWDDERLFQEARRILVAQMQHLTYNEWLPIIIGREKMAHLGMLPLEYGFSDDYDEDLNPTIHNEFAAAAFRFGHTLVQGKVDLLNKRRKKDDEIRLRNHFFKSQVIYKPGNLDKFLVGLATQPIQSYDNYITEELTNHLFQEPGRRFGMDLIALNLQRGRDHGIPGYNAYRSLCGRPRARDFSDLLDDIPEPIVDRFRLLYRSVDDVDLFIGSISENPARGALIGATFQCIVADTFLRLKRGDRFFYDLKDQPHSFTKAQLSEIRKTSFSRLLCDNSKIDSYQPLAFKLPSDLNPVVSCDSSSIPTLDLSPWQDDDRDHDGFHPPAPYNEIPYKSTFFFNK